MRYKVVARLIIASILGLAGLTGQGVVAMAAPPSSAAAVAPNASTPGVVSRIYTLDPATCALTRQIEMAVARFSNPKCQAILYSYSSHQSMPAGTKYSRPAVAADTWTYLYDWQQNCSIAGCWVWGTMDQLYYKTNGFGVWTNGGPYCTPSGIAVVAWCGATNNGAQQPPWTLAYGDNTTVCLPTPWGCVNINHGTRTYINRQGLVVQRQAW